MSNPIEVHFSLLGAANAADRLARAFNAFSESLRLADPAMTDLAARIETARDPLGLNPAPLHADAYLEGITAKAEPNPAAIFGGAQAIPPPPAAAVPPAAAISPPQAAKPPKAPPAPTGEVDSAGHVWDERIHSSTKVKVADGTWRKKRGVTAGAIAQVDADPARSQQIAAEIAMGEPPRAHTPGAIPPPPPPPAPVPGAMKFSDVVTKVQAAITAGTMDPEGNPITQASLTIACGVLGLKSFPELAKRPDLFATLLTNLGLT